MEKKIQLGLFGYGCVGQGIYELLRQADGVFEIRQICIKDNSKPRDIPMNHFTVNPEDILNNPEIQIVVELINDPEAAYNIVTGAIRNGKHVISANKKLIANHFHELSQLADEYGVSFLYEASVCASIPIIGILENYYSGMAPEAIRGICNGTSNYILSKLFERPILFSEALSEAQELGFAESDPTSDIDGYDSKYKLKILMEHAFGSAPETEFLPHFGIRNIRKEDIEFAHSNQWKIRLLSSASIEGDSHAHVSPYFVAQHNPFYSIENEMNAIEVHHRLSHGKLFTGKGAGKYPTAEAVFSDLNALLSGYTYKRSKPRKQQSIVQKTEEKTVKVYVSAHDEAELNLFPFSSEIERIPANDCARAVGEVRFDALVRAWTEVDSDWFVCLYSTEN